MISGIEATQRLWNMTCKGLNSTRTTNLRLSVVWLSPVIPGNVDGISTRLAVSVNLFLTEMTEKYPGISCEVHILPHVVLTLVLNQWPLNQWEFNFYFFYFFNWKFSYLSKVQNAVITTGFDLRCVQFSRYSYTSNTNSNQIQQNNL